MLTFEGAAANRNALAAKNNAAAAAGGHAAAGAAGAMPANPAARPGSAMMVYNNPMAMFGDDGSSRPGTAATGAWPGGRPGTGGGWGGGGVRPTSAVGLVTLDSLVRQEPVQRAALCAVFCFVSLCRVVSVSHRTVSCCRALLVCIRKQDDHQIVGREYTSIQEPPLAALKPAMSFAHIEPLIPTLQVRGRQESGLTGDVGSSGGSFSATTDDTGDGSGPLSRADKSFKKSRMYPGGEVRALALSI